MFKDYKILQKNADGKRHYEVETPDGKTYKLVGNTTLLDKFKNKDALFAWRKSIGEEAAQAITTKAANRGTKVHTLVEHYLTDRVLPTSEDSDTYNCFLRLKPVLDIITPFALEKKVYWVNDDGNGFAGTLDIGGHIDTSRLVGRVSGAFGEGSASFIGDWKTFNKPKYPVASTKDGIKFYPLMGYALQLAAYTAACNQQSDCYYALNKTFIFGVTSTCRAAYVYYFSPDAVNWYWDRYRELLHCYYSNDWFDWALMEQRASDLNFLGERVDLI